MAQVVKYLEVPTKMPLCHKNYFELKAIKKQQTQEKLSLPSAFLPKCMHAKLFQSHPTLFDLMDYNLPGPSINGLLQARILELVVISSSRGSPLSRDRTRVSWVSCIGRQILYH